MSEIVNVRIELSLKIKTAFVKQIDEPKSVTVMWVRGKRNLESAAGIIDPTTHEAKIEDVFKMKTALEFDIDKYKFEPKNSVLELQFTGTKDVIGHAEFDLGMYANRIRDKTVKTTLDLKSDKFPGCQIYIYVNVSVLDALPEKGSKAESPIKHGIAGQGQTIGAHNMAGKIAGSISKAVDYDKSANQFEITKKLLEDNIQALDESKNKLDRENEKLKFYKKQAECEKLTDAKELLQKKDESRLKIMKNIEKYDKQQKIITKVLDVINNHDSRSQHFEQSDSELNQKKDLLNAQWTEKQEKYAGYKSMKDNFNDPKYYVDFAQW